MRTPIRMCVLAFFVVCSVQGQEFAPDSSTMLLLHLNETVGDTAHDAGAYQNHGVATGTTITWGRYGNARAFQSGADYVTVPDDASLNFSSIKAFTVECWAFIDSLLPEGTLVAKWGPGGDVDDEWGLTVRLTGVEFTVNSSTDPGSPNSSVITSLDQVRLKEWIHIACTWDGNAGRQRLYINGELMQEDSTAVTSLPHTVIPLRVGYNGAGGAFRGIIDEVRVSNRVRLPGEFYLLDPHGVVAYYPFDGNANDESGFGRHGVVTGASLTSDRFGTGSRAYSFDGIDDYIEAPGAGLPGAERTVSLWFYAADSTTRNTFLGYGGSTCGHSWIECQNLRNEGRRKLFVVSHCGLKEIVGENAAVPWGMWYHLAATTSPSGTRIYLNGALLDSNTVYFDDTHTTQGDLAFGIGVNHDGGAPFDDPNLDPLKGRLDDVAIFNRALTGLEIDSLFHLGGWPPPTMPLLLEPENGSIGLGTNPLLRWYSLANAEHYRIQVAADSLFASVLLDDSTVTDSMYLASGLLPRSRYFWRVAGRNGAGMGSFSLPWAFSTAGVPDPVALVSPPDGASYQPVTVAFCWTEPSVPLEQVSAYWLELVTDTVTLAGLWCDSTITDTSTTSEAVVHSVQYYWRVKAGNQAGWGGYSPWWYFSTQDYFEDFSVGSVGWMKGEGPGFLEVVDSVFLHTTYAYSCWAHYYYTPQHFGAGRYEMDVFVRPDALNTAITWRVPALQEPSPHSGAYQVRFNNSDLLGTPGVFRVEKFDTLLGRVVLLEVADRFVGLNHLVIGDADTAITVTVNDTQYGPIDVRSFAPLRPGYFVLTAADRSGGDYFDNVRMRSRWPLLVGPTLFAPLNGSTGLSSPVQLRWGSSPGTLRYLVQVATDSGFSSMVVNDSSLVDTSLSLSSLQFSTTYYWRVGAIDSGGASGFRVSWKFRTIGSPCAVQLIEPEHNAVDRPICSFFRWAQPLIQTEDVLRYWFEIVRDTLTLSGLWQDTTMVDTFAVLDGLAHSTDYFWRVRARNEAGWGEFSPWWRFTTVVAPPLPPQLVSPLNGTTGTPLVEALVWEAAGADSCHLQLGIDPTCAVNKLEDSLIVGNHRVVSGLQSGTTYFWRLQARNRGGLSGWSAIWEFETSSTATGHYPIQGFWNLMSVPLTVDDCRTTELFPGAISQAFSFHPSMGYRQEDSLRNGHGYWLKFGAPDTVTISGGLRTLDTLDVAAGWNLIGCLSTSIDTGSVVELPAGLTNPVFFGYEGTYFPVDTLYPAKAYWIKAKGSGKLVLSSSLGKQASYRTSSDAKLRRLDPSE
ncbi:MAG: LamG-like jellyroll fold domain-containing protein [Bacteroidota bacterium]